MFECLSYNIAQSKIQYARYNMHAYSELKNVPYVLVLHVYIYNVLRSCRIVSNNIDENRILKNQFNIYASVKLHDLLYAHHTCIPLQHLHRSPYCGSSSPQISYLTFQRSLLNYVLFVFDSARRSSILKMFHSIPEVSDWCTSTYNQQWNILPRSLNCNIQLSLLFNYASMLEKIPQIPSYNAKRLWLNEIPETAELFGFNFKNFTKETHNIGQTLDITQMISM